MCDPTSNEPKDDLALLRRYAAEGDEAAFAEVVERYVGLVYAAALRQLGGSVHRAREVTQLVFIDLARKGPALAARDDLAGWLYTSTHYAAAKLKRGEQRRERREQEVLMLQNSLPDGANTAWEELRPVLDDAMLALSETDRAVLLQRFFHGRRFADIGRGLATSEDAARMRVERALEKLRMVLGRRGITSTTAALAGTLAHPTIAAAPAGLAASVTGTALAGGVMAGAAGAGILFMSTKKMIVGVAVVLALGTGTVAYRHAQEAEGQRIAQAAERERAEAQTRAEKQRAESARAQSAAAQRAAAAVALTAQSAPAAPAKPGESGGFFLADITRNADGTIKITKVEEGEIVGMKQAPVDPAEREKMIREVIDRSTNSGYGTLYALAGWNEEQREQFRNLMYARAREDQRLYAVALREARAKNPQFTRADQFELREAMNATNEREERAAVLEAMGEEAAELLGRYQATMPMRSIVRRLTTVLAEAGAPLEPPQAERLIEALAAHARGFDGRADILALDLDAAMAQAPGFLGETQVATLRGIVTQAQEQTKRDRERNMAPAGSLQSKGQ